MNTQMQHPNRNTHLTALRTKHTQRAATTFLPHARIGSLSVNTASAERTEIRRASVGWEPRYVTNFTYGSWWAKRVLLTSGSFGTVPPTDPLV